MKPSLLTASTADWTSIKEARWKTVHYRFNPDLNHPKHVLA